MRGDSSRSEKKESRTEQLHFVQRGEVEWGISRGLRLIEVSPNALQVGRVLGFGKAVAVLRGAVVCGNWAN